MSSAVRFANYGGPDALEVVEVDDRPPGVGEVRVAVVSAGVNRCDIDGSDDSDGDARPKGKGSDFAGLVAAVGEGVTSVRVGDEVIGFSDCRNGQAEFATVHESRLIGKPDGLDWHTAGALYVAGTTAQACVDAVAPRDGETVVVAGAAGGVGVLATQLAIREGARVIATARECHHDYLRGLGAVPVTYGDGLRERVLEVAEGEPVVAFIDAHGNGNVDLAVDLGVAPERINTVADFDAAKRVGAQTCGQDSVDPGSVLRRLSSLLTCRQLELPIRSSYPLARVRDAYRSVAAGHGLGKVVIDVRSIG